MPRLTQKRRLYLEKARKLQLSNQQRRQQQLHGNVQQPAESRHSITPPRPPADSPHTPQSPQPSTSHETPVSTTETPASASETPASSSETPSTVEGITKKTTKEIRSQL